MAYPYRRLIKPRLGTPLNKGHSLVKGQSGCYLMNEGGKSKVYDLSGNGNTGTFVGGVLWTPGKFGSCLSFDGVSGTYVDFGKDIIPVGGSVSISAWFKTNSVTGNHYINGKTIGTKYPAMALYANKLAFAASATAWLTTGVTTLAIDTWYHGVVVYDGTNRSVYLNGGLDNNTTGAYTFTTGLAILGGSTTTTAIFNGVIDGIRFWNRALSASEIAQHYREPFAMFRQMPIHLMSYSVPAGGLSIPVAMAMYNRRKRST